MNDVKVFGAAGDGIHKDTAAIQAAIDKGGFIFRRSLPERYAFLRSNGGLDRPRSRSAGKPRQG